MAQNSQELVFTSITKKEGLPNEFIQDITKDSLGFIWFATREGLCRYEGPNKLKIFTKDSLNQNGLQSDIIRTLFCDSNGMLWIGTTYGGISKYDPNTDIWQTYRYNANDSTSLSHDEILSIYEDSHKQIWVGTEKGLNLYSNKHDNFTRLNLDPKSKEPKTILSIMEDDKGWIWVGTWGDGLYMLSENHKQSEQSYIIRNLRPFEDKSSLNIWSMLQDSEGRYWLGSHGGGLILMHMPNVNPFSPSDINWRPTFHRYAHTNEFTTGLSNNAIHSIAEDQFKNLWIATVYGLHKISSHQIPPLNTVEQQVIHFDSYQEDAFHVSAIISNNITKIKIDDSGLIWIATNKGVSQYNWVGNQFKNQFVANRLGDLKNNSSIAIDTTGHVWLATNNALRKYWFTNESLPEAEPYDMSQLIGEYISSINMIKDHLYVATEEGINIIQVYENRVSKFAFPDWLKVNFEHLEITCLEIDDAKNLWLGSKKGLIKVDHATKEFSLFEHNTEDSETLSDNSVNDILKDKNGNVWVATYDGLNKIINPDDKDKIQFEKYFYNVDNPEIGLVSNAIMSLSESDGFLYIATLSGLCKYDYNENTFIQLNSKNNGFEITSMEHSDNDEIWMGTESGIVAFNKNTNEYTHFEKEAGLIEASFRLGSSTKHRDGFLFYTNKSSIIYFNPKTLKRQRSLPPVYVTGVEKMNPKGINNLDALQLNKIELQPNDFRLSVKFSSLNYQPNKKHQIAYKLDGFEENWNYVGTEQEAVYTNLKPKEYTFLLKASDNYGNWAEVGDSLTIIKKPALRETWWFWCLLFLGTFSLVYAIVRWYINKIKQHNENLQSINLDLNREIQQRKTAEDKLKENNDDLIRSNKDLEQFAYVASHDLKEPLRVISNFSGLISRRHMDQFDKTALTYIDHIKNSAKRLTTLVDNLLSFSMVGQKDFEYVQIDLNQLVDEKIMDLNNAINNNQVIVKKEKLPKIKAEKTQIGIVFFNLINNAIKFNSNENPQVQISEVVSDDPQYWKFCVSDNGIGIEEKYKSKIFDIFQKLHGKEEYEGTGIGLSICKKIINNHKGEIWFDSIPKQGTKFYFTIKKDLGKS